MIVMKLFLLIIVTDFLTGTVHWWEDAYGNPSWKFLGKSVVIPNLEHHQCPRKFFLFPITPQRTELTDSPHSLAPQGRKESQLC